MEKSNISKNLLYTQKHFDLLVSLYKFSSEEFVSLKQIVQVVSETLADGLNINRVGFWKLSDAALVCINVYDSILDIHIVESDLIALDFPVYFNALKAGIAIVADDALENKYTKELSECYLKPNGITAMMDIPIRENGLLIGVLCCEHKEINKKWDDVDLAFSRSIGYILSLLLEQYSRRILELELIEKERKLSLITDNSKDGFVVFENKRITYVSPSYLELLGYTEIEALTLSLENVFQSIHPEDVENVKNSIYYNLSLQNKNFVCEFRFKTNQGNYIWREDTASVIYDAEGNYQKYIIISRDISILKKAHGENEILYSNSKKLNQKLLDFTHIVSHNIRSNTSNMSMLIDLIDKTDCSQEKDEYFELLKESNVKLSDTIFHLNETIDLQINEQEMKRSINFKTGIDQVIVGINEIIKYNKVQIDVLCVDDLELSTIPIYFESIFFNLFTNAIKYKSNDRDLIVQIQSTRENDKIIINFTDNGIGIDMSLYKDKIFGMYKTFHGNADAVGLGLYMTQKHVEALGGTISVDSTVGIGTNFKIVFYG